MNGADQPLVIGTRGSALARAQTETVELALRTAWSDLAIEIKIIKTSGDEAARSMAEPLDRRAGRKGMFTAEIERSLLANEIDLAVHSAKDLPSEETPGLGIAAVLPRAPVEDVLIMKAPGSLVSLRSGAVVATGSVRRAYQLQAKRPDLRIADVRGNVPTRLRKLIESDWDALVLARAGLNVSVLSRPAKPSSLRGRNFSPNCCPAMILCPLEDKASSPCKRGARTRKQNDWSSALIMGKPFCVCELSVSFYDFYMEIAIRRLACWRHRSKLKRCFVPNFSSRNPGCVGTGNVRGNSDQPERLAAELIKQINGR